MTDSVRVGDRVRIRVRDRDRVRVRVSGRVIFGQVNRKGIAVRLKLGFAIGLVG